MRLENDSIPKRCKRVHCVDLGESFPTHIFLQNLASIQKRTSLVKFARSPRTDPPRFQPYFKECYDNLNVSEVNDEPAQMIVFSDDGKDLDDELAKVLCSSLCRRQQANVLGYVANLAPSMMRARLSKGTLRQASCLFDLGSG